MKKILFAGVAGGVCLFSSAANPERVREYTDFLYSTMTLADSLDYPRSFYERNVELALDARERLPWGKKVPEREFRNFVLPVRVNNEHLDSARMVFFRELAPLVEGLSMSEAALEINHWLHERVTYRPSDARTSPPLSTIRTSFGRCGEESTLGVAAMRAMGIPARQVYTPRWAHTDDNHAWVEVWTDGKWHFLGACEPEAVLDLAWFNAPAARGMLMNTNALGGYDGPEEVLGRTAVSTRINVTSNYAPVDTARVRVVDISGNPVEGAAVSFRLYNYAELYPLAEKVTDAGGNACLTAGLGDMVAWATAPDGHSFGFSQLTVGAEEPTVVVLDRDASWSGTVDFTLVPPAPGGSAPQLTQEQMLENARRLAQEDSVRHVYMDSFFTPESAVSFVSAKGWPEGMARILPLAYGNHRAVTGFMESCSDKELALMFLNTLSEKDLRDVEPRILADFYREDIPQGADTASYVSRVMCPRVYDETLTPWHSYFNGAIPAEERMAYGADPSGWVRWIAENIDVASSAGASVFISPEKVYEHRRGIPPASRDIFAVASMRAMGVESYLDPVNLRPRYVDPVTGADIEMAFADGDSDKGETTPQGRLRLSYDKAGRLDNPAYYYHFTLSGIKNGQPVLYNFPESATYRSDFAAGADVDAGQTLLVSGQRLADGAVLTRLSVFNVKEGAETVERLVVRQDTAQVQVIGSFNSENIYHDLASDTDKSILSTTGRGYYVLALIRPNHEPTSHILNDISAYAADLEKWGGKIMLLFADGDEAARFSRLAFPDLPSNVVFGTDKDMRIAGELGEFGSDRPLLVVADTFNRVVYASEGYTINMGLRLVDLLGRL